MDFFLPRKFLLPHDEKIFLWHGGAVFSFLCKKFSLPSLLFLHFYVFVFLWKQVCVPIIYIKLLNVFNNLIRYTPSGLCFLRLQKCKNAKTQRLALLGCAMSVAGFPFISYSAIYVCFPWIFILIILCISPNFRTFVVSFVGMEKCGQNLGWRWETGACCVASFV